jgi:hypothetical protein
MQKIIVCANVWKKKLGDQKFRVDREVEAIVTPWLIWQDRDFNQQEI